MRERGWRGGGRAVLAARTIQKTSASYMTYGLSTGNQGKKASLPQLWSSQAVHVYHNIASTGIPRLTTIDLKSTRCKRQSVFCLDHRKACVNVAQEGNGNVQERYSVKAYLCSQKSHSEHACLLIGLTEKEYFFKVPNLALSRQTRKTLSTGMSHVPPTPTTYTFGSLAPTRMYLGLGLPHLALTVG